MNIAQLKQDFLAEFGRPAHAVYFAPGRVNLIGEHIDYNGGRVLPAAIDKGTYFVVAANGDARLDLCSVLFDERRQFDIGDLLDARPLDHWTDFPVGMSQMLTEVFGELDGLDVLIANDLPPGSGLSSSASFSVGFGFAVLDLLGLDLDPVRLALTAQSVENHFVGMNCGIMDQFAVAMGRADHCIVLDCDTLDHELLPMNLDGHEIVIANSMVPRKLAESKYNERRSECDRALEILQEDYPVTNLCALNPEQVDASAALREHDVLYRRARHAAGENARVFESVEALKAGELERFGSLMNASHDSLRDDYEVSCPELDLLVDTARSLPGVLGSRMTGAGFGGCTVSIVATDALERFRAGLIETYAGETGLETEIHTARPGDGVKRVA